MNKILSTLNNGTYYLIRDRSADHRMFWGYRIQHINGTMFPLFNSSDLALEYAKNELCITEDTEFNAPMWS